MQIFLNDYAKHYTACMHFMQNAYSFLAETTNASNQHHDFLQTLCTLHNLCNFYPKIHSQYATIQESAFYALGT